MQGTLGRLGESRAASLKIYDTLWSAAMSKVVGRYITSVHTKKLSILSPRFYSYVWVVTKIVTLELISCQFTSLQNEDIIIHTYSLDSSVA
jgi:hypothetical protein